MRVMPRSIQGRMIALSAIATLVALAIAGTLIAGILARIVTGGVDRRLDAELALMASAVSSGGVDRPRVAALRGALDAGEGWRWRITAPAVDMGSDDMPTGDEFGGRQTMAVLARRVRMTDTALASTDPARSTGPTGRARQCTRGG